MGLNILLKFGTKENLEKLQNGEIFFGTGILYDEIAKKGNNNIGDEYEGAFVVEKCSMAICNPETGVVLREAIGTLIESDEGINRIPFFCCTYISDENIKFIDGKYKFIFDDDFKECFMKEEEWEYVLAIDKSKFIERIRSTFKDINILAKPIKYENYGYLTEERNNEVMQNAKNVLSWKNSEFSAQKEFRIILKDKDIGKNKYFIGNIGNISDISRISKREDWFSQDVEIDIIINK